MFGDEKSMITLGTFPRLPTIVKTFGGKTPFTNNLRICSDTNFDETVMLIKPGPEYSI